jgi:uncharacterized protein (TIGR02246 family)
MEKQIAQVMNTWVEDWNEKRIDDLTKLYYSQAVLLPADGSRAEGQSEIRASLQKQIGSKVEVRSLGPVLNGSLAYENGTYTQTKNGQSGEGNYLVVLIWDGGKWLIIQHASTAKQPLK